MRTITNQQTQTHTKSFDDKMANLRQTFNQRQKASENVSLFIDTVKKTRRKKTK